MKIIACLSWFDESPTWLANHVASCARFCDHIVACDGAYALYPDGRPSSGSDQHAAILGAAEATGMAVTIHVPRDRWFGNEVAKRDYLMRCGVFESDSDDDWLFVIDADEKVIDAPSRSSLHQRLSDTPFHVAEVTIGMRYDHYAWMSQSPAFSHISDAEPVLPAHGGPSFAGGAVRRLFRARRDLRVEGAHYLYRVDGPSGEPLDLWNVGPSCAPAERCTEIVLEHRNKFRDPIRHDRREAYYRARDAAEIEPTWAELQAAAQT